MKTRYVVVACLTLAGIVWGYDELDRWSYKPRSASRIQAEEFFQCTCWDLNAPSYETGRGPINMFMRVKARIKEKRQHKEDIL